MPPTLLQTSQLTSKRVAFDRSCDIETDLLAFMKAPGEVCPGHAFAQGMIRQAGRAGSALTAGRSGSGQGGIQGQAEVGQFM